MITSETVDFPQNEKTSSQAYYYYYYYSYKIRHNIHINSNIPVYLHTKYIQSNNGTLVSGEFSYYNIEYRQWPGDYVLYILWS